MQTTLLRTGKAFRDALVQLLPNGGSLSAETELCVLAESVYAAFDRLDAVPPDVPIEYASAYTGDIGYAPHGAAYCAALANGKAFCTALSAVQVLPAGAELAELARSLFAVFEAAILLDAGY